MSHPEGPHSSHELDQIIAAMRDDKVGVQHVVGTLAILDTLLEELPTADPVMGVAVVRLDQVRAGIELKRASFLQIHTALTEETP